MISDRLSDLDLAAYLCSRVCHDVISPVGAIVNGLELLDDEPDDQMRVFAMDLVRNSALNASAKLKFARLAFGAAGSAGAEIDMAETQAVLADFMAGGKVDLEWGLPHGSMTKNKLKLLLNLVLVALQAIPRGGRLSVLMEGTLSSPRFILRAAGGQARLPRNPLTFLSPDVEEQIDTQTVQSYYTALIAEQCRFRVQMSLQNDIVTVVAESVSSHP